MALAWPSRVWRGRLVCPPASNTLVNVSKGCSNFKTLMLGIWDIIGRGENWTICMNTLLVLGAWTYQPANNKYRHKDVFSCAAIIMCYNLTTLMLGICDIIGMADIFR